MSDGRKNNGGNSTKASRPDDKRLNPAKQLLNKYIDAEFDYTKLSALLNKLYKDAIGGDIKSASLFLSYALGKPKESHDHSVEIQPIIWKEEKTYEADEETDGGT